jgi:hypothetical protein
MLKSGFTSLALGATIGVATLATDITPVPLALAQVTPSSQGPAFDAGLADRRAYGSADRIYPARELRLGAFA